MSLNKKSSSNPGSPHGPAVVMYYPYSHFPDVPQSGAHTHGLRADYMPDLSKSRNSPGYPYPSGSLLPGAYGDQPLAFESGNPAYRHTVSQPQSYPSLQYSASSFPGDNQHTSSGHELKGRYPMAGARDDGGSSQQAMRPLAGHKRQLSPEKSSSQTPPASGQSLPGPSKAARQPEKKKYKEGGAAWQRVHRDEKNEKLTKLNSLLPLDLQTFHDPPRMLPIVTGSIDYIEQLLVEKKQCQDKCDVLESLIMVSQDGNSLERSVYLQSQVATQKTMEMEQLRLIDHLQAENDRLSKALRRRTP
ncbi:hypothetical protein EVG20_g9193 [Dentipellis fragilis]|uniref:BHLH domain-containing protein n=1 Tax=Dentipellis fragilis TaxID=205917 RepID=A0A4Y9Y0A4_9AGAM|nr:hypothetical protein EVG20_g9193 [Dentipellis fragilis]